MSLRGFSKSMLRCKQINIECLKIPTGRGRPPGVHSAAEELNLGWLSTNPVSGMVEDLTPWTPDYKSSTHLETFLIQRFMVNISCRLKN